MRHRCPIAARQVVICVMGVTLGCAHPNAAIRGGVRSNGTSANRGSGSQSQFMSFVTPTLEQPLPELGTMWTFESPPLPYWKKRYDFVPRQQWLDHVRKSALRLPNCSASFVSATGLVLTNHHCARECAIDVSPADTDYMKTGFVAASPKAEKRCTKMWVDQLQSFEVITDRVISALPKSGTATRRNASRDSLTHAITSECEAASQLHCEVVSYYQGGAYSLYRFRRYTDVRLVMMPEKQIAAFGGDPDNFVYPRWALDFAILRVYENGIAVLPSDFLRWSPQGAGDGDATFTVGNPYSTERLLPLSRLEEERDVVYRMYADANDSAVAALREVSAAGPSKARALLEELSSTANEQKLMHGLRNALFDSVLMRRKTLFEKDLRGRVNADPELARAYGSAWDSIAVAVRQLGELEPLRFYYRSYPGQKLMNLAFSIVRVTQQASIPDSARMQDFHGSEIERMMSQLREEPPVDTAVERQVLRSLLQSGQRDLPADDSVIVAALHGESPDAASKRLVAHTEIATVEGRNALLNGGAAAVARSRDPFIALARIAEPRLRSHRARTAELQRVIAENQARIGAAAYAVYGRALPPDATFSLRISDGAVLGYKYNGTLAPWKTTFFGLYDRAASFDQRAPFDLPTRWNERRGQLDLSTPFDMVTTSDVVGGNSGSPVINRNGEIVGLAFDGNLEGLSSNFLVRPNAARAICVTSNAIIMSLRKVYEMNQLADELEGSASGH